MATQSIQKETLLKLLVQENTQVLSLAYIYAKQMSEHGIDVTQKWETATQQAAALYRAECDGYVRAKREFWEFVHGVEDGDGDV